MASPSWKKLNSGLSSTSIAAFKKLDRYHMLIDGVNVSSEHLGPVNSQESHETCDISDYTWNIHYLLMATGEASYANKIERAAFNAAPGSVTSDFKALQYFSAPNQVIAARGSFIRSGGDYMRYAPNPGTECCPGNVNRMMPNIAIHSWMSDGQGGIVAALYTPSSVSYPVGGEEQVVTIDEDTHYPFSDSIRFTMHLSENTVFNFYFRIPGWCRRPRVFLNGKPLDMQLSPGSYIPLRRLYRDGDRVTVVLPAAFTLVPGAERGISLVRGPLVYALKIDENWKIDSADARSTADFPAYELFAKSPWNYALCLDPERLRQQVQVVRRPFSDDPWGITTAPVELRVPARLVQGWVLEHKTSMKKENWTVERDARGKVKRWYIAG